MGAEVHTLRLNPSSLLKEAGLLTYKTFKITEGLAPLTQLIAREKELTQDELSQALDQLFEVLYEHPLTKHSRKVTTYLRNRQFLPNEDSTEQLIRFVVEQLTLRSPIPVPEAVINEFWNVEHIHEIKRALILWLEYPA